MKSITAIIRPYQLDDVRRLLREAGAAALTVTEVKGFGHQQRHTEVYRGAQYTVDFLPKLRVELVVNDAQAQACVDAIVQAARTGKVGDGKVFVTNVERAVRIRSGATGEGAL